MLSKEGIWNETFVCSYSFVYEKYQDNMIMEIYKFLAYMEFYLCNFIEHNIAFFSLDVNKYFIVRNGKIVSIHKL